MYNLIDGYYDKLFWEQQLFYWRKMYFLKVSLVERMKEKFWPRWDEEIEQAKEERCAITD